MKCFGRLPKKNDPRTLKLAKYAANLPPAPSQVEYAPPGLNWEMAGNDQFGDCVLACKYHMLKSWIMDESSIEFKVPEKEITTKYFQLTGGRDAGLNLLDVNNEFKSNGLFGHKIDGYAQVNVKDLAEVKQAIYLFGGLDIGISVLPQFEQAAPGGVWKGKGRSLGGHGIPLLGYDDAKKLFTLCSWGSIYYLDYDCFSYVCDEGYALMSPDWCNQFSPAGFNCTELQNDLQLLT